MKNQIALRKFKGQNVRRNQTIDSVVETSLFFFLNNFWFNPKWFQVSNSIKKKNKREQKTPQLFTWRKSYCRAFWRSTKWTWKLLPLLTLCCQQQAWSKHDLLVWGIGCLSREARVWWTSMRLHQTYWLTTKILLCFIGRQPDTTSE